MGKIILITGGARCGKSSFAEDYVKKNMIKNENYEEVLNIFDSDLIEMEE